MHSSATDHGTKETRVDEEELGPEWGTQFNAQLTQARRKQFGVGLAKIGSSAEGASKLGGPGACSPGKF